MALQPIISQLGGGLSSVTGPSVGSDAPVGANLVPDAHAPAAAEYVEPQPSVK